MVPLTRFAGPGRLSGARSTSRGQVLVIWAAGLLFFIGLMALVIDVSWYWSNSLRVQRTADAAALAGAIYLPGNVANATSFALAEAKKNGYIDGTAGVSVTPTQDVVDDRQLDVTVTAPVEMYFMRVFGITSINATRSAKGIYVQPVPMGSPENYYGVYCLTTPSSTTCNAGNAVPDASGSGTLASKGFWGAFQSTGDPHNEGDAFTPYNDFLNPGSNPQGGSNPDYDPTGYDYAVEVPANGGSVYVFDPTFCPVGSGFGSGDHYNSDANRNYGDASGKYWSVSSYYQLWNTNGTLFTENDDTSVASSGTLFQQEFQTDQSTTYGTVSAPAAGATSLDAKPLKDCRDNAPGALATEGRYWHDKWWPIATGLPAGVYRLNVKSAAQGSVNWKSQAENDFSLEVRGPSAGGKSPRVYGLGRMASYNILTSGIQSFYLAQIDAKAAGKTIEIDLFDPGDVSGNATLKIKSPDGNVYNYATFAYSADANCLGGNSDTCSGTNRTSIKTAVGGSSSFNNTWVTITIPLPATYGSGGLTPSGETQPGWWKIEYNVSGGNDTTTWMVNLRGNPVHLIVP
ncbi:MAG: pilus assembly protein TadG-related protein [Chloroflexota bacterium]|nr:pilus assembly protein TadG-related protein [Chloroflexota bacterium]